MKKYILAILISFIVVAFVIGNLDPMQWEMHQRAHVVLFSVFACAIIGFFEYIERNEP